MHRILRQVGVPDNILKLIPGIVATCASCRAWHRPGPASVATAELADTFNQQVEFDLMFMHKYIIFHLIDRCTRWHAACTVPDKHDRTLVNTLDSLWVAHHGPMRELIADGECGLAVAKEAKG